VRIAVFSDVHGNLLALDAVLHDAYEQAATHFWCLGDVVAHGPRPAEAVSRIRRLPHHLCVRGNTDRYVLTGDLSGIVPPIDRPRSPEEYRVLADARESFAWTRGCLVGAGQLVWLDSLPLEQRFVLPDGTQVLLVHASPGRDDGLGLRPDRTDEDLADAGFGSSVADLILVGHTHLACERRIAGSHVLNPGPVSLSPVADDRAGWALIESTPDGHSVELRSVQYDVGLVVEDLDQQRHPSSRWLAAKMTASRSVSSDAP
jgi:predicted phosphodiesterase